MKEVESDADDAWVCVRCGMGEASKKDGRDETVSFLTSIVGYVFSLAALEIDDHSDNSGFSLLNRAMVRDL